MRRTALRLVYNICLVQFCIHRGHHVRILRDHMCEVSSRFNNTLWSLTTATHFLRGPCPRLYVQWRIQELLVVWWGYHPFLPFPPAFSLSLSLRFLPFPHSPSPIYLVGPLPCRQIHKGVWGA